MPRKDRKSGGRMLLISLLIIASSSSHLSPVSSSAVTQQNSSFFKETSQLEQMMHMDEGDGMGRAVGGSAIQLRNITDLLDTLLLGYDQHLRPDMGGAPTEVLIDLHVRSMGPIEEIDMAWKDSRLAYDPESFQGKPKNLALSVNMLDKIWKPDTFFYNGKKAYIHTITNPNKLLRIASDGMVLYSSRMTVKASCPMRLERFPMDVQRCPLEVGSFGYSSRDVLYRWNPKRTVVIASDMRMSQFDLTSSHTGNVTGLIRTGGPYSRLVVSFHFKRLMGSFVIEVYAPGSLLVIMSWVSFWINREASEDRVNLGITTFLTMTFLGLETRNDLPKVSYMTALDYFVAINFAFLFASFIEFAIVHWYTKIGTGDYFIPPPEVMKKIALAHAENFNWFGRRNSVPGSVAVAADVASSMSQESMQADHHHEQLQADTDEHDDPAAMTDSGMIAPASDHAKQKKDKRIEANHTPNPLPPHHAAAALAADSASPNQREQHQDLLLRQLNQEICDVQNILSSVPLSSTNPRAIRRNVVSSIINSSTTAASDPLRCQEDALLQLSSCYLPREQLSDPAMTTAAAAPASRYLPSAYATLYGQLDTSIYPHNRKQKQGKGKKNELGSGQQQHHQYHHHQQVTKKKLASSEFDALPSLLIQDGFREEDFCPVHGKIINRSSTGTGGRKRYTGSGGKEILSPESTRGPKEKESRGPIMVISDNRMPAIPGIRHTIIPDPMTRIGKRVPSTPDQQVINRFIGSKDKVKHALPQPQVRPDETQHMAKKRKRYLRAKRSATMRPFDSLPIRLNSVSQIDVVARVVFPICFLLINYFYWITYLGDE